MKSTIAPPTARPSVRTYREDSIRHLPAAARAALDRFGSGSNPSSLDPVLLAILDDYIPRTPARPLAELPGDTRLIEDLGFDSLAITEVVFFTEDLFGITITNEEIVQVRSLDDLRRFIRHKLAARPGP